MNNPLFLLFIIGNLFMIIFVVFFHQIKQAYVELKDFFSWWKYQAFN